MRSVLQMSKGMLNWQNVNKLLSVHRGRQMYFREDAYIIEITITPRALVEQNEKPRTLKVSTIIQCQDAGHSVTVATTVIGRERNTECHHILIMCVCVCVCVWGGGGETSSSKQITTNPQTFYE